MENSPRSGGEDLPQNGRLNTLNSECRILDARCAVKGDCVAVAAMEKQTPKYGFHVPSEVGMNKAFLTPAPPAESRG